MPISVVFDPPLPSDSPSTFNTKAFTLLGDLNDWSTQANALPGEVATNLSALLASPPAIGSTTPAAASFTTLSASGAIASYTDANTLKLGFDGATGTLAATRTSGNYSSLEFRTSGADGNGLVRVGINNAGVLSLTKGQLNFPATQVPSADANTLDDYEEGTWTPTQGGGLTVVGTFSSTGTYTKIGNHVTVWGCVIGSTSVAASANTVLCGGLPFSSAVNGMGAGMNNVAAAAIGVWCTGSNIYSSGWAATPSVAFTATYTV